MRIRTTNSYLNGMQTYVSVPRHKFLGMRQFGCTMSKVFEKLLD